VIDLRGLSALCGFVEVADFQQAHRQWVEEALNCERVMRDDRWSEAVAVGSSSFVDRVKSDLGFKARYREVTEMGGMYTLREQSEVYVGDLGSETGMLMADNSIPWQKNADNTAM
jgi:hypothetical protein